MLFLFFQQEKNIIHSAKFSDEELKIRVDLLYFGFFEAAALT